MAAKSKVFFKNVVLYRLDSSWQGFKSLNQSLQAKKFSPCLSQEQSSRGFIAPRKSAGDDELVLTVNKQLMLVLQTQTKILPSSVVNEALAERVEQITDQQGFVPGRKQIKELKEAVFHELLPKAFIKNTKTRVWLDPENGWLAVEASSQSKAEDVLSVLYDAVDSFPVSTLRTTMSPQSLMTAWLANGEGSNGFTIDRDCELRSVTEEKAAVRYVSHALDGDEIQSHLSQGKVPTRLAMSYDDKVSFVLTESLQFKGLKLLDIKEETAAQNEDEQFDIDFTVMTGTYAELFKEVVEVLGGELEAV